MSKVESLNEVIREVQEYVSKVYEDNWGKYPTSHDYLHIIRVLTLALKIADEEHLDSESILLLKLACLLHDIAIPITGCKQKHAEESAKIATQILKKYEFTEDEIRLVCSAIREHSWSKRKKPATLLSAILQDADRLDALGVIGFARMICYGEFMKRKLHHPTEVIPKTRQIDDERYTIDHVFAKLVKLPQSMNTETGKRLAKERVQKLLKLTEEFEKEVQCE
ncbi:MAG: phosphohydrolase [Candidatus Methanomethylicota archaeon]|uniref:Phosphohydrolase n=1 Tax=Thermoproteota archaeon TaxID=2056631 RepID=A0A497F149_9CREN|nr:MAG: phosphohydrolase [Candidatus Verstraetearchaeota archaeon]